MRELGYQLVSSKLHSESFGNLSAVYERADCFSVRFTTDRGDFFIDIKPRTGLFASSRWYHLYPLFETLKEGGYSIEWAKGDDIESTEVFIRNTLTLLISLKEKLTFSYLDGLSIREN